MRSSFGRFFLCLLHVAGIFFVCIPVPACGAESGFSSVIEHVSAMEFPKIHVTMRVFTKEATELTFDSFSLIERKNPVSTFTVSIVRREPFVTLLLDRSSSMETVVGQVKESAAAFVKGLNGPVHTSLVTFASDIDLVTDFTREQEMLLQGIAKMRPWGGTALFDGLYQACEQLRSGTQTDDQKTIVLLTDGRDESPQGKPGFSTHKADEVIAHARKNNIRVICVALGTTIDETFLKQLAAETKGALLRAPSADKLMSLFQAVCARMMLERRYKISYTTPAPQRDGSQRDLMVSSELKGFKDQGTGFYTAPTDSVKAEISPGKTTGSGKGVPDIGIRDETASSAELRMGTKVIRHDAHLGRVQAPELGKGEDLSHLDRQQLATWTNIATETIPIAEEYKPIQVRPDATEEEKAHIASLNAELKASHDDHQKWRQDFTSEKNQRTEQLNRDMRDMHENIQKGHDQYIDGVNRDIDGGNESNRELHESNQRSADKNAAETNKTMENLERDLTTEYQIPAFPGETNSNQPETPEPPSAGDDD